LSQAITKAAETPWPEMSKTPVAGLPSFTG
jgi:hypothetical protein